MWEWVGIAAAVWLLWQVLSCWFWPLRVCGKCAGAKKFRSPNGKHWRVCRRCRGSGSKVRLGRRVWDLVTNQI